MRLRTCRQKRALLPGQLQERGAVGHNERFQWGFGAACGHDTEQRRAGRQPLTATMAGDVIRSDMWRDG